MTIETKVEYRAATHRRGTELERACIVLLESELDIALGFLHLADVETESANTAHADELIARANTSYKTVLNGLTNVGLEFEEERQLLREGARMLQDAIRAAVRHRQQDASLHQLG